MKQDALDHLADALMEDIAAASGDDLLAEVREDFGDAGVLAVAFDEILAGTKALALQQSQEAAIGKLADALCEDVAPTAPEALLQEAAEDYGDRRALAAEFDRAVLGNAAPSGATKMASAEASIAGEEWRRAFARPVAAVGPSTMLKAAFTTLLEWLTAPMRSRTAIGALAAVLLIAILAPGLYERFLERSADRIAATAANDPLSPAPSGSTSPAQRIPAPTTPEPARLPTVSELTSSPRGSLDATPKPDAAMRPPESGAAGGVGGLAGAAGLMETERQRADRLALLERYAREREELGRRADAEKQRKAAEAEAQRGREAALRRQAEERQRAEQLAAEAARLEAARQEAVRQQMAELRRQEELRQQQEEQKRIAALQQKQEEQKLQEALGQATESSQPLKPNVDQASVVGGRRVALVIGNSNYKVAYISLPSPRNDAEDISAELKTLGFEVVTAIDATKRDMDLALARFARLAIGADSALFFYAGHAMQFGGRNFLMPTDAQLEDEISVRYQMVSQADVTAALDRANGVKIMILDASRNNPLTNRLQTRIAVASRVVATTGLARMDKTQGMVVAYATLAGELASDGDGRSRNSPFTAALLKRLQEPGLEIATMFRRVAADVIAQTGGRQRPEATVSLLSEYYLNQNDRVAWERTDQVDVAALRDFIRRYDSSPLAIQARYRLDLLERAARDREEMARRARDEEQGRLAAARRMEEEQARIAALGEHKRQEGQRRIAALPVGAPATKVPPASTTPDGLTTQPQATKANLPEQIRQAQTELKRLGCFDGKLDGQMNTTEKAIKAFWKRANKPIAEINITDDFIADLQRQPDDICAPSKPPAVANRPSQHNKGTAAAAASPRPQQPASQPAARATADDEPRGTRPRPPTSVGF